MKYRIYAYKRDRKEFGSEWYRCWEKPFEAPDDDAARKHFNQEAGRLNKDYYRCNLVRIDREAVAEKTTALVES